MDNRLYYNLFGYWRGPNEGNKVLENNVTKALINVLELSNDTVRGDFISWLGEQIKINLQPTGITECVLFPARSDLPDAQIRVMLGIKPYWASELHRGHGRRQEHERRYDGALVGQGWLVAIETKINKDMDTKQFEDERRQLGRSAVRKVITWRQIHEFFSQLKARQEPSSALLINQLCEYLDLIGQVGFQGFKERHFDCITSEGTWAEDKGDIRNELRGVMNTLGGDLYEFKYDDGEILKELYADWDDVRGLRKGRSKYDWAYLYFFPCGTRRTERAHQSITLDLRDLTLSVWARVTTQEGLAKLHRKVSSDEGREKLTGILKGAQEQSAPIWFDLYHDSEKKKYQSVFANEITGMTIVKTLHEYIDKLSQELHKHKEEKDLTFALGRGFFKEEVIRTGSYLVREIANTMRSIHPFVQFVNSRKI